MHRQAGPAGRLHGQAGRVQDQHQPGERVQPAGRRRQHGPRQVLKAAGLDDLPGVTPSSVSLSVALDVYAETGRVEAVAARLGLSSLDTAASIVGADTTWRGTYELAGPEADPS